MADIDKNKIFNEISKAYDGKMDMKQFKNAANKKDVSALVSALPEDDKAKIMNILNDKDSLNNLLKNPQVSSLLNNFLGKGEK